MRSDSRQTPWTSRAPALLGVLLLVLAPAGAWPEDDPAAAAGRRGPVHRIPGIDSEIRIDGYLNEEAWSRAAVLSLNYETDPGENVPAPVATECRITYDRESLYVAFRALDPEPRRIRARLADRDSADSDDLVGIVLDTMNDGRRAVKFWVNPLGVQMDMTVDDVNGREDSSWDAIWHSAGRLDEQGYVVELAIPFSSLAFQHTQGPQTWGIDVIRSYPRSSWHRIANNPQDRDVDCYLCQISKLEGFDGITPGRNLEINPTVTAGRREQREDFPDGGFADGVEDTDPGLNVSWGITPNMLLSATLNPDFSQVEADVAQLDINRQFTLFFPERRPFFLEGADLFRTPLNAVFTRNVADPSWGTRLTGKQGRNAFGVFVAEDELTNLVFPGSQGSDADSFDFPTTDTVLRYRRDLGKSSALGALLTSREGTDYSNRVMGVDGLFRFTESDSIRFQALASQTEYPAAVADEFDQPAGSFDDHAFRLTYVHADEQWRWWVVHEDIGEGFRADMGFMPQVDVNFLRGGIQRTWWGEEEDFYNSLRLGGGWDRRQDASGRKLDEIYEVFGVAQGPLQSYLETHVGIRQRFFNGVEFDEEFFNTYFEFLPTGDFFLGWWMELGDEVDFANTRPGKVVVLEPSLRWDFGKHLRTRLSHRVRRLDVDAGTLFEANLTQVRFLYQLNLRTFVRAIFQLTDIERDTELYVADPDIEARTQQLFTQLLFSYKLNPRTVLFLGYSDNYQGDQNVALTQENRAVFMKVGYAWVL